MATVAVLGGFSDSAPMLGPLLGYFFSMITMVTAAAVLLTGFVNISPSRKGSQHLRPSAIGQTVMVETQRHSPPAAKEASPAKTDSSVVATAKADTKKIRPAIARTVMVELQRHSPSPAKHVSPVVSTAKADNKKIKHYKPKVLARQRNNYGNGHALGYAEQSGYGPSSLFFR